MLFLKFYFLSPLSLFYKLQRVKYQQIIFFICYFKSILSLYTGKTHLATALGIEACNLGKKVKFFKVCTLVNELMEAYEKGELRRYTNSLHKYDLLICDEWGYIPISLKGAELLFQVIADCYERKSLIITTNLEFGKWISIFMDRKLTSAIIDRVIHHSHLLVFDGESYRIRHSKISSI